MTPSLLNRIRLARQGSAVERCHTVPHAQRYSVGHHSLDLITLVVLTWQAAHGGALPSSELLVAAAFHDIPEVITGDVPSVVKGLLGSGALDHAELQAHRWLGVDMLLSDEEGAWLHACDRLELRLWAQEEAHQRGNRAVQTWTYGGMTFPHPVFDVFNNIEPEDWGQVTWPELKEISGL